MAKSMPSHTRRGARCWFHFWCKGTYIGEESRSADFSDGNSCDAKVWQPALSDCVNDKLACSVLTIPVLVNNRIHFVFSSKWKWCKYMIKRQMWGLSYLLWQTYTIYFAYKPSHLSLYHIFAPLSFCGEHKTSKLIIDTIGECQVAKL